jgi:hypothetical protein
LKPRGPERHGERCGGGGDGGEATHDPPVSLAAAGPAAASTTKCNKWFCAHVVGGGLHVDWVQTYSDVPLGKTYKGFFTIYTRTESKYEHNIRWYRWTTPTWYVAPHRFYSVKVWVNRTFHNATRLYIAYNRNGAYHGGGVLYAVIHS